MGANIDRLVQLVSLGVFDFFGHRDYEAIREALDAAYLADCRERDRAE